MKKQLLLTITISYATLAITPTQLQANPNGDYRRFTFNDKLQRIEPVTVPLGSESQEYVTKTSQITATVGAFVGLGVGYAVNNYIDQNRAYNKKYPQESNLASAVLVSAVSTAVTSCIGYVTGMWYATGNTPEKIAQSNINSLITRNNNAINASERVFLTAKGRTELNNLPFDERTDQSRSAVYKGLPVKQSNKPISARVEYTQNLASALRAEQNAITAITDSQLNRVAQSPFLEDENIIVTIAKNREDIAYLNSLLPHNKISSWYQYVEEAPEYKREHAQQKLNSIQKKNLREKERTIQEDLVHLAALYGYTYDQLYLSESRFAAAWAGLCAYYPDTYEGHIGKEADIQRTKNRISSRMQEYQSEALNYSNSVIEHNKLRIPENVVAFIRDNGGRTDDLDGYQTNQNLLAYNTYLNHNDGRFLIWCRSCIYYN